MASIEEMKEVVREDFKKDEYNELIGFMTVENDVNPEDCIEGFFKTGQVIVVYKASTGDVAYTNLEDQYGFIMDEQEEIAREEKIREIEEADAEAEAEAEANADDDDFWE